jgi:hypothetical protein
MKILILVMAHKSTDSVFTNYKKIWDEQLSLLNEKNVFFTIKYLYCNNEITESYINDGNNLITKCTENYWYSLLLKVLSGLDFFEKNNFDLVFKTNLSTIINFEKFLEYCQSIPNERKFVYDGVVGFYEGFKFCSGSGFLLNSNSVKLILDSKNLLEEKWTDDIFIGYVLNNLNGLEPNIGSLNRFDIVKENTSYTKEEIRMSTHIRIKIRRDDLDIYYSNDVFKILTEK